jgi:gamma-glutamylcysteine synthetase
MAGLLGRVPHVSVSADTRLNKFKVKGNHELRTKNNEPFNRLPNLPFNHVPIMQNKANLLIAQMTVTIACTRDYENVRLRRRR